MKVLAKVLAAVFSWEKIIELVFMVLGLILDKVISQPLSKKGKRFVQLMSAFSDTLGKIWIKESKTTIDDEILKGVDDTVKLVADKYKFDLPIVPNIK